MALKNQKGQTLVEYILLLSVAVGLVYTLLNSAAFKRLFGEKGSFGTLLKNSSQYSYRHGSPPVTPDGADASRTNRQPTQQFTYYDTQGSTSRFFGPIQKYPP